MFRVSDEPEIQPMPGLTSPKYLSHGLALGGWGCLYNLNDKQFGYCSHTCSQNNAHCPKSRTPLQCSFSEPGTSPSHSSISHLISVPLTHLASSPLPPAVVDTVDRPSLDISVFGCALEKALLGSVGLHSPFLKWVLWLEKTNISCFSSVPQTL